MRQSLKPSVAEPAGPRDVVLDALVRRLQAQRNTRALGEQLAETVALLRRTEHSTWEWSDDDRHELLGEIATSHAARIEARRKGARPPSHLYDLRELWDTLSRCVTSILATAPPGAERVPYCRTHFQTLWVEWLGKKHQAAGAILDHALEAEKPELIAFRLLAEAHGWPDREKVRRSLKRVKLRSPW